MISTDELRFFAAVAGAGSLAAAARSLDVTPPAVTQRLRSLETRLGVRLANRSGRQLTLTDEGELLARRGQAILDQIFELRDAIAARRGSVLGHLKILAPLGFGRRHVAPAVASFRALHPDLFIDLMLSDRLGRHPTTSWDIAIHIGALPDSNLIAQRLAPNQRVLCAAPSYLKGRAAIKHPHELLIHDCLALRENDEDVTLWRFARTKGKPLTVRIEPRLATNDGEVLRNWALDGLGIVVRSEWDVAEPVRDKRLVRLLPDYHLPEANVTALLGSRSGRSARARLFLEHIHRSLTPAPWRRG